MRSTGTNFLPSAGEFPESERNHLNVDEWWTQAVWWLGGISITRKDLILTAVDKDGGAHVDVDTSAWYRKLSEDGWGGLQLFNPSAAARKTHFGMIRAIGQELLVSEALRAI